ncbi:unnamed protein product [Lota lota]
MLRLMLQDLQASTHLAEPRTTLDLWSLQSSMTMVTQATIRKLSTKRPLEEITSEDERLGSEPTAKRKMDMADHRCRRLQ